MSPQPISRSPDLKRLRDEGYDVEVVDTYLVMRDVPYLTERREVKRGALVSDLTLANDVAEPPARHTIQFAGEYPCDMHGVPIEQIRCGAAATKVGDLTTSFIFSARPKPADKYPDYYSKMTTYADILGGPVQAIGQNATARTFPVITNEVDEGVFNYLDTASSRADVVAASRKLALSKIAIIGLGGTGSYVLDLLAKTHVREIHLFDGDTLLQHNAFRAPGAASGEELAERMPKVKYFERAYAKMRKGIVPHPYFLKSDNLHLLDGMDFVFVCMEGSGKEPILGKLEADAISFIDVGMGVYLRGDSLGGVLRTTTSTPSMREHVRAKNRIPISNAAANEYDKNIQIADLNALNAALAVIRWKKLFGFYLDQEQSTSAPIPLASTTSTMRIKHEARCTDRTRIYRLRS